MFDINMQDLPKVPAITFVTNVEDLNHYLGDLSRLADLHPTFASSRLRPRCRFRLNKREVAARVYPTLLFGQQLLVLVGELEPKRPHYLLLVKKNEGWRPSNRSLPTTWPLVTPRLDGTEPERHIIGDVLSFIVACFATQSFGAVL